MARSAAQAFKTLGVGTLRLVAPPELMPQSDEFAGCQRLHSLEEGIRGVDVVMMLRIQRERMVEGSVPDAPGYFRQFGLTSERLRLAKADAIMGWPVTEARLVEKLSCLLEPAAPTTPA